MSGGGSGVGIAALLKGAVDIANASRDIKPSEVEQAREEHRQEAGRLHRGLRRARRLRPQGQPALRDHRRAADRPLRRGRQDDALVRARGEDPRRLGRHHRAREPPVELRHLRVLPRARPRQQGLPPRLPRPERVEGGRRARGRHAHRDRLQRHGLRDAGGQDAEGHLEAGEPRGGPDRRGGPRQDLPARALAPPLHARRAAGGGEAVHRLDPVRRRPEGGRGERVRAGPSRPARAP